MGKLNDAIGIEVSRKGSGKGSDTVRDLHLQLGDLVEELVKISRELLVNYENLTNMQCKERIRTIEVTAEGLDKLINHILKLSKERYQSSKKGI